MAVEVIGNSISARDREVLAALRYFTDEADRLGWNRKWARPMDVGGFNGSHHGRTLVKLRRLGLAEARAHRPGMRRVFKYRITEAGRAALSPPVDWRKCRHEWGPTERIEEPIFHICLGMTKTCLKCGAVYVDDWCAVRVGGVERIYPPPPPVDPDRESR